MSRGFCLTGTLRVPASHATGHAPLTCLSANSLTAGATGSGPREPRAWAAHVGGFGERCWRDPASIARGINSHGLVVGKVLFDAGEFTLSRAFYLAPGGPAKFLVPPQGGTTFVTGVNEAGEIVFNATPLGAAPDQTHAWCFRDGAYLPLEALGGGRAWAAAITPRGLVVGHAHDAAGTTRAVRWYRGQPLDLNMRGAYTNEGLALNEHSTVVGRLTDPTGERRAFRRTPEDGLVRLEDLLDDRDGWQLQEAVAVNAPGSIVGTGRYRGEPEGFSLTLIAP